jgi:phenylpyruvate tautomerase PptA (4-oxalocrotonate tautomerase family)
MGPNMPMIDLTLPKGALSEESRAQLMGDLSRALLRWEGAKPGDPNAASIAWTFAHEPELVTVAHEPAREPRYRVVVGVPQGTLGDEEKEGLVAEVTEKVLRAESPDEEPAFEDSTRVWVIINEIADGNWGGAGRIFRLADIMAFAGASEKEIERRSARLRQPASV